MQNEYKMSYLLGGLYYNETILINREFDDYHETKTIKDEIVKQNLLKTKKERTAKRMASEIIPRIESLTDEQREILKTGSREEKKQILWLACCKTYRFINEFARDILHEYTIAARKKITTNDYEAFYNNKADKSNKLASLKESTRKKLRAVLFKMMREAEMINREKEIIPVILSKKVRESIKRDDPNDLLIFPEIRQ